MSWLWRVMRPIVMPLLRAGLRIKVVGRQNVPKEGPAILASNHLSALDHVVLPAVTRRPIVNISKVEHFESGRVKAWFFRQWHVIPVRRGTGDQGAMDAARQALREGHLFCIYPEGTRSLDGKLHKGRTGVARLALELQVPVIPVAMVGTYEAWPKGGKLRLFRRTKAVVGEPMHFRSDWGRQDDRETCRRVTDAVMRELARLSGQEYVDEYQENPDIPKRDPGAKGDGGQAPAKEKPRKTASGRAKRASGSKAKGAKAAKGRGAASRPKAGR